MKRFILALLSTCCVVANYAQSGEKNFIDQNYIEVSGKAEAEVQPDRIYLKIILDEKDFKTKQSLDDMEKRMLAKLRELGIDVAKDLSLLDFASNFKSYIFSKDVVLIKDFQLIVRDTKTLQAVFYELRKLGISNISIEKTEYSDIEQLRKDVKVKAVKAAREKAGLLAEALGQSLGRALYLQETQYMNPEFVSNAFLRGASSGIKMRGAVPEQLDVTYQDLEFEKIKVESSLLLRFELK